MPDYPYLRVTFRAGKFFAAYLFLAEPRSQERPRTKRLSPSILLDLDEQSSPVGVEILSRESLNADTLNALLKPYGARNIDARELSTAM